MLCGSSKLVICLCHSSSTSQPMNTQSQTNQVQRRHFWSGDNESRPDLFSALFCGPFFYSIPFGFDASHFPACISLFLFPNPNYCLLARNRRTINLRPILLISPLPNLSFSLVAQYNSNNWSTLLIELNHIYKSKLTRCTISLHNIGIFPFRAVNRTTFDSDQRKCPDYSNSTVVVVSLSLSLSFVSAESSRSNDPGKMTDLS